MFWMESPETTDNKVWEELVTSHNYPTDVFSRGTGVVSNSFEHKLRVSDDLQDELHSNGHQETKDPVINILRAPEKVEQQAEDDEAEAVRVEHVLGGFRSVPLLHIKRPPCTLMPSHLYVGRVEVEGTEKILCYITFYLLQLCLYSLYIGVMAECTIMSNPTLVEMLLKFFWGYYWCLCQRDIHWGIQGSPYLHVGCLFVFKQNFWWCRWHCMTLYDVRCRTTYRVSRKKVYTFAANLVNIEYKDLAPLSHTIG